MLKSLCACILSILLSTNALALTNSTFADSPEWAPVTLIKSEAPDSSGESIPAYCNGTFIGKTMMVTAAHCVKFAYASRDNLLNIQTGYYKYITRPTGEVVRIGYVAKAKFNKHVNIELPQSLKDKIAKKGDKAQIGPDEDFALLWWDETTPETDDLVVSEIVTPMEHAQITKNLKAHQVRVVSINFFSEMSMDTLRMGDLDNFKWSNGYIHSTSNVRVQEGDSGAPVYVTINNKRKIFGVVKGRASTVFSNWDVYPAINPHICAINKRMPSKWIIKSCL